MSRKQRKLVSRVTVSNKVSLEIAPGKQMDGTITACSALSIRGHEKSLGAAFILEARRTENIFPHYWQLSTGFL